MGIVLILALAAVLGAQDGPPMAILRGMLLKWDAAAGELSLRTADHRVWRCRFDQHTYLERDRAKVSADSIRAGEVVEMIADRRGGPAQCLAVTLSVIRTTGVVRAPIPRPPRLFLDNLWPRGNLTFAGLVRTVDTERLVVRTRASGDQTFRLRPDTSFAAAGLPAERVQLTPHTRVFVRAGRNWDGDIEAYQVIWGEILTPPRPYSTRP